MSSLSFGTSTYGHAVLSDNGRLIAYPSPDGIMIYDRVARTTVTAASGNVVGNFALSGDGRYLAFARGGQDSDVYLLDRNTGVETLVSHEFGQPTVPAGQSSQPSISQDGAYVTFASAAANVVGPGEDLNQDLDIFLWGRATDQTERVSRSSTDTSAGGSLAYSSVSDDGQYVVFDSTEPLLPAQDLDANSDIYVWNHVTGGLTLVPMPAPYLIGYYPVISGDASTVVFHAYRGSVDPETGTDPGQVFLWKRTTNTTVLVSASQSGPADGESNFASVSDNGQFVTYCTSASDILPGDDDQSADVVQWQSAGKTVKIASQAIAPTMSGDGRFVISTPAFGGICYGGNLSETTDLWDRLGQAW